MSTISVFASGTGSNFEALADAGLPIALVVCDHADAPVVAKAQARRIATFIIDYRDYPTKAAAEAAILAALPASDLIVLAGYMRIIGPTLLAAYPGQIINLHPALLPSFPGRTGIADAYAYGVKVTGVTVHVVDAGIDSGRILAQAPVRILPGESLAHLEARIHAVEHQLLPHTVAAILKEELAL